jgi:archaellin
MRIVELILGDEEVTGIEAISVVENPAIEEDFIALKNEEIKLAEVSGEKRILLGALLIPNKPIYRRNGDDEYYIYFSKETVEKASQLYLQNGNQNKATLEHQHSINGLTLVESWIVEDETHDKSRKYGLNVPVGTWMGAVKVNNQEIWESYVRTKKIKGFSIEGYFADKMERPKEPIDDFDEDEAKDMLKHIRRVVKQDGRYKDGQKEELESYTDYPSGVKNNAKRGIELNEKVNNKCATDVGKIRAQQLAQGKPISKETIKRMYSYLSRAEEYYNESDTKACGTISYLLWGGKAGKRWAESKLKELGELDLASQVINDEMAIIDDRLAFSTKELAIAAAKDIGCESYHEHEYEGKVWYMPCEQHDLKKPCAKGFVQYGMKTKNGQKVPNCIKIDG